MKIYAPVKDFNGWRCNVRFVNGVGETNDPAAIKWFETHGYKVPIQDEPILIDKAVEVAVEVEEDPVEMMGYADKERALEDMNPLELRELAKASGKGHLIKNIRDKEKLIKIIRG